MNAIVPAFGCLAGGIPFDVALDRVLGLVTEKLGVEDVPLAECVGRVIAASFDARLDLPGFDQSAMDGYAVRCADLMPGTRLPVIGRTAAGEPPGRLGPSGAHRILTGAPVPDGADAVIAQESVDQQGDLLRIGAVPLAGTNLRRRGEDIRVGQRLAAEGTSMDWRHVAVLAAQGVRSVTVRRRPRVALLSSGRELRAPCESLAPGQIHDTNLPMLAAFLQAGGAAVRAMAVVNDEAAAMRLALRHAALDADLVLTTAGISVGDEDHVRDALLELGGDLAVLKVAMKPGKPLAAGRLGDAVFIGLPGNPMAALAGAIAFVRPLLARMAGTTAPAVVHAHAAFDMCRRPGRTEFIAVCLRQRDACLWAERTGSEGSGRLGPLLEATGFAVLPAEKRTVRSGDEIEIIPFTPGAFAWRRTNVHG
jgi:molybdopterin molybdotransferase